VGPLANTVRGTAMLLEAVAGHDPLDSTSIPHPAPACADQVDGGIEGLKIGVPREYFVEGMEADVEASVRTALAKLEDLGAELVEVSLPHTEYAVATYYLVATAEASSNLGRYDGVRYGLRAGEDRGLTGMYEASREAGFGSEVKRRIMLGSYALSAGYYDAYYLKAMKVRTLIRRDFEEAFSSCDAIVTPTAPCTAFEFGSRTDDPLKMYLSDVLTISVNLAGLPGLSLPCGLDGRGMPIGLQVLAPALDEPTLFRVAAAYEAVSGWAQKAPESISG
ncbi:MAG: amidase family protein, partial [Candidatus Binatia bacterium]